MFFIYSVVFFHEFLYHIPRFLAQDNTLHTQWIILRFFNVYV